MREILCFNISSYYVEASVIQENGHVLSWEYVVEDTEVTKENAYESILKKCKDTMNVREIAGISISSPGQVDTKTGTIIHASADIDDYTDFYLKEELENEIGINVVVENDVNCSALAESWKGSAKEAQSMYYLHVGHAIGGGYVINHELISGAHYELGQLSYVPYQETYLKNSGSFAAVNQKIIEKYGMNSLFIDDLVDSYKDGQQYVVEIVDEFIETLVSVILSVKYTVDPEKIVIGGDIKLHKDFFQVLLENELEKRSMDFPHKMVDFEISDEIAHSRLIGALRNYLLNEKSLPKQDFLATLEFNRHSFTKGEKRIVEYIEENLERVPTLSISEFANIVGVSDPTITRFSKKIGFKNLGELKSAINHAILSSNEMIKQRKDSVAVGQKYTDIIEMMEQVFSEQNVEKMVAFFTSAEQFIFLHDVSYQNEFSKLRDSFLKKGKLVTAFFSEDEIEVASKLSEVKKMPILYFNLSGMQSEMMEKADLVFAKNDTNQLSEKIISLPHIDKSMYGFVYQLLLETILENI